MAAKVRWGVLGSSPYLLEHSFPEIARTRYSALTAVASRSRDRAIANARRLGVDTFYDSYEALLEDPSVEVVYNALPHHLHAEWSLRALAAGKHVLCEKPLARTAREGSELIAAAGTFDSYLFEGQVWRHHPQWAAAKSLIDSGAIGEPKLVRSHFGFYDADPSRARNDPSRGGGALSMIGGYAVAVSMFVFDGTPMRGIGNLDLDPELGVDRDALCLLTFDRGRAQFSVGSQSFDEEQVSVHGSAGSITLSRPFTPRARGKTAIALASRSGVRTIRIPPASQFALQADAVSCAILRHERPDLDESLAILKALDALRASSVSGVWEDVE